VGSTAEHPTHPQLQVGQVTSGGKLSTHIHSSMHQGGQSSLSHLIVGKTEAQRVNNPTQSPSRAVAVRFDFSGRRREPVSHSNLGMQGWPWTDMGGQNSLGAGIQLGSSR
jgi:hypothetical protein